MDAKSVDVAMSDLTEAIRLQYHADVMGRLEGVLGLNGALPAAKRPTSKRGKWKPGSRGRVPAWYKAQQRKAGRKS